MNRRDFLGKTMKLVAGGLILPPLGRRAGAQGWFPGMPAGRLRRMSELDVLDGKILVILNLSGGNDGLNTVVPYTDNLYYTARQNIAVQPGEVVPLDADTGLHPGLAPLQGLWDGGRMAIVRGVGYPQPNLSHFRSTDIWFSASSSTEEVGTGWLARYVEAMYPEFPGELPFAPYGLQQGIAHEIPLKGDRGNIGVVVDNPDTFFQLVNQNYTGEWNDELPETRGGEELGFLREVDQATFAYADAIGQAADAGVNTVAYPQTTLGVQLEIVARLISGALDTPLYLTAEFGFDTHVNQLGQHANLMGSLGGSVAAFFQDLDNQGLSDRVVLATVSEFGRRVDENGGFGTDHGTAAPLFVMGAGVNGGLYGTNPNLADLDPNGNMHMQHDFRQVYSTLLQGHFRSSESMASDVLMGGFDTLDFMDILTGVDALPSSNRLAGAYPNPVSLSQSGPVLIQFELARSSKVEVQVFDVKGRRVSRLGGQSFPAGSNRLVWEAKGLSAGVYMARVRAGNWQASEKLLLLP